MPCPCLSRLLLASGLLMGPALRAEVPPEQALGLYAQTPPEHRAISPYLGMVALKSGILANVRFFGNYTSTLKVGLPPHPSFLSKAETRPPLDECPQDAVAAVVQYLFPSPDGFHLVHNQRSKDPLGDLSNDRAAGSLRRINTLLDAVTHYRARLAAAAPLPDPAADEDFRAAVLRILGQPAESKASRPGQAAPLEPTGREALLAAFAPLLQRAVLEESTRMGGRYPANIVEVALLAFAWQAADDVGELQAAFAGGLLMDHPDPDHRPPFDETFFRNHQEEWVRRLPELAPDELALFLYGNEAYGGLPPGVTYTTTRFGEVRFPDCGETSLLNVLDAVLVRQGRIPGEVLAAFLARLGHGGERKGPAAPADAILDKIQSHFTEFPDPSSQMSALGHEAWAKVVSGLNRPGDPLPITYRNGDCNLAGTGIGNMLNLIAHLLPDPVLGRPWPDDRAAREELRSEKLDRLCALATTPERTFGWRVAAGDADPGEFPRVTFTINEKPVFVWAFEPRHFAFLPVRSQETLGWVGRVRGLPGVGDWLQGWFQRQRYLGLFLADDVTPLKLARPAEAFFCELQHPDEVKLAIRSILESRFDALAPTLHLVVSRTLPWDLEALDDLSEPVARVRGPFVPIPALLRRTPKEKQAMAEDLAEHGGLEHPGAVLWVLLAHGLDPNMRLADGTPLVIWTAVKDPSGLPFLLALGADPNARDRKGRTALHAALNGLPGTSGFECIKTLLKAGADPLSSDRTGRTPLAIAQALGKRFRDLLETAPPKRAAPERKGP